MQQDTSTSPQAGRAEERGTDIPCKTVVTYKQNTEATTTFQRYVNDR